ncbi:hypothetical protein BLD44_019020 [Mastigocladus laminosus UU774]|nr:hypothetical protein B4U84_22805 [Westiellopsis prolifica IICB1]TFI52809.1 hypothetical protein BLD44_019020 [Mastigocladus laminosus UU774]
MNALLNTTTQFGKIATIVTERVAQLLCTEVFVIDQDAHVIASSNPKLINYSFNYIYKEKASNYLRVPLSFNTQVGEVIVSKPRNGEVISSRLVQELVELVISQTTISDRNQVYCLDGLGITAFVGIGDERTKIELAAYLLSPLNHEPELLATLDTFFAEDCCPSSTANRLSIHRNTLSYRLDKVKLLTGLNPRHFDDAVQIRLALLLRKLNISDVRKRV